MKMQPVSSSSIQSVGYDGTTQTLRVRFQNQSINDYKEVPHAVFRELLSSDSLGSYLNHRVRDRYPVIRLSNIN